VRAGPVRQRPLAGHVPEGVGGTARVQYAIHGDGQLPGTGRHMQLGAVWAIGNVQQLYRHHAWHERAGDG
jgi:hypothetical protein